MALNASLPIIAKSATTEVENLITEGHTQAAIVLCHTTNVVTLCVTLWILISMFVYGTKTSKWRAGERGKLYIICFVAIVLTLPRLVMMVLEYHVRDIPGASIYCEELVDITNAAYGFPLLSKYFFLWMRQRTIYQHSCMRALHGKFVNIISWLVLIMITISGTAIFCGYIIPLSFTFSAQKGCVFIPSGRRSAEYSASFNNMRYILLALMIFTELVLLSLFIYPMIRIRRSRNVDVEGDSVSNMVRRSTISSSIAVFSDTLTTILVVTIPGKESVIIGQTMYNVSLLINDLSIAFTFEAFPKILTLFCRKNYSTTIAPVVRLDPTIETISEMHEETGS